MLLAIKHVYCNSKGIYHHAGTSIDGTFDRGPANGHKTQKPAKMLAISRRRFLLFCLSSALTPKPHTPRKALTLLIHH